jgi:hypothetical protein
MLQCLRRDKGLGTVAAKSNFKIKNIVPSGLDTVPNVDALVEAFLGTLDPLEASDLVHVLVDARTKARYCECHILASKLVPLSTTDVPLDPEDQPEYRANREIVTSHYAFEKMQQDAKERRSFSNLVTEFTTEYDPDHPLKIIGGQHRYEAIKEA